MSRIVSGVRNVIDIVHDVITVIINVVVPDIFQGVRCRQFNATRGSKIDFSTGKINFSVRIVFSNYLK